MSISNVNVGIETMIQNNCYINLFTMEKQKSDMDMDITRMIVDQNEINIVITKSFEVVSHIKGYHVYKAVWSPLIGESLLCEREPDNPIDKYAVCVKKEKKIVGHLPFGKSGKFAKTIFYFLRADEVNLCKLVVTGKSVNFGDGEGMQVPCKLTLIGTEKCIDVLKKHL